MTRNYTELAKSYYVQYMHKCMYISAYALTHIKYIFSNNQLLKHGTKTI